MRTIVWAMAACLGLAAPAAHAKPVLNVYTYSSFTSEWGPGPKLEAAFERQCDCDLVWTSLDDGVAILSRLALEGPRAKADVVLGLDTSLLADARKAGVLAPHGLTIDGLDLPVPFAEPDVVPYDWGYFAFVYDQTRLPTPPTSLAALAEADPSLKIVIQDPRTSTPGLGLLLWVRAVEGEGAAEWWRKVAPHVLTVTKGWSEAYDLFLKGEAQMVLSYTTSPAYHVIAEDRHDIKAAPFAEGHYLQVELAGVTPAAKEPELARKFLAFLVSPEAQAIIPTTNWMFPVRRAGTELPGAFDELVHPARSLLLPADQVQAERAAWVDEWLDALQR